MSAHTEEVKMAVVQDLGLLLDDHMEAAEKRHLQFVGGEVGAKKCTQELAGLMPLVIKEFEQGKLSMEEAQAVKKWLNRALGTCAMVGNVCRQDAIKSQGLAEGLKAPIAVLVKKREAAEKALASELAKDAIEEETGADPRRPARSLKSIRRAADAAEAAQIEAAEGEDDEVTEISEEMLADFADEEGVTVDQLTEKLQGITGEAGPRASG
jgi:hypothetical protein